MKTCEISKRNAAFSLIEMIGVLAVIAALAAMITPPLVRKIAEASRTTEEANLKVLAQGLMEYVKDRQNVPGVPLGHRTLPR